jgi:hypothetical protein
MAIGEATLTFSTFAEFESFANAGVIASDIKLIELLGYHRLGDEGAGARYRRTSTQPAHGEHKQIGSGVFFELSPLDGKGLRMGWLGLMPNQQEEREPLGTVNATPFLDRAFLYCISAQNDLSPAYFVTEIYWDEGWYAFTTKPAPWHDLPCRHIGTANTVFHKMFVSAFDFDGIFNFGDNSTHGVVQDINFTATVASDSAGTGTGCFISLKPTAVGLIGNFRIIRCNAASNNHTKYNFYFDSEVSALSAGTARIRIATIQDCQMFACAAGAVYLKCVSGFSMPGSNCAAAGGTSALVHVLGVPAAASANITLNALALSGFTVDHCSAILVTTPTCAGNITLDHVNDFQLHLGRVVGNITTTTASIDGQINVTSCSGSVRLNGPRVQGRGHVAGGISGIHPNSEWDRPPGAV